MANVGSAYVTLMPSMQGFAASIDKEFAGAGSSAGKEFGNGLTSGVVLGTSKSESALGQLASEAKDRPATWAWPSRSPASASPRRSRTAAPSTS